MHFHPALAPVKVAVLPLTKKQSDEAMELYNDLVKDFYCEYDQAGQIGRDIEDRMLLVHHYV